MSGGAGGYHPATTRSTPPTTPTPSNAKSRITPKILPHTRSCLLLVFMGNVPISHKSAAILPCHPEREADSTFFIANDYFLLFAGDAIGGCDMEIYSNGVWFCSLFFSDGFDHHYIGYLCLVPIRPTVGIESIDGLNVSISKWDSLG